MQRTTSAARFLESPALYVPVDATWFLPNAGRNGRAEFDDERIPGSVFFDIDEIKSPSPYPHMMPSKLQFDAAMSKLGLKRSDKLLVYDKSGLFSAPRAKWMLDVFMHPHTQILDNWLEYKKLGGPIETGASKKRQPTVYESPGEAPWVQFEDVRRFLEDGLLANKDIVLVDARPRARFTGQAPEPRPETPSGHVPGALSLPFTDVLENGHYKDAAALKEVLHNAGIPPDKQVVVMCGTGVTACVVKEGIDQVLDHPSLVYDGSWTEWAQRAPELIEPRNYTI